MVISVRYRSKIPSGVEGARLEGWPPLLPDASVRGEEANIDSDMNFGTNATDESKLTNATDGPNDKVLFVGKYKVLSKVPRKRLAGAAGWRDMVHVRVSGVVARIGSRGSRAYPSAG